MVTNANATEASKKKSLSLKRSRENAGTYVHQRLVSAKAMKVNEASMHVSESRSDFGTSDQISSVPLCGLDNMGNTCYINSVIQCLRFSPGFQSRLAQLGRKPRPPDSSKHVEGDIGKESDTLFFLVQLLEQMSGTEENNMETSGPVLIQPLTFTNQFQKSHPAFEKHIQHDAQEFLRSLIESLQLSTVTATSHTCRRMQSPIREQVADESVLIDEIKCNRAGSTQGQRSASNESTSVEKLEPPEKLRRITDFFAAKQSCETECVARKRAVLSSFDVTKSSMTREVQFTGHLKTPEASAPVKHSSSISVLFEGSIVFETKCLECECRNTRSERFLEISIPVTSSVSTEKGSLETQRCGLYSLFWSISQFASIDRLHEMNKYSCATCRHLTEAQRTVLFSSLPQLMTIHLKRFSAMVVGSSGVKIGKTVGNIAIPLALCFKQWCTPSCPERDSFYELYAVVFHTGDSCISGHYTAAVNSSYCKRPSGQRKFQANSWIYFDDHMTTQMTLREFQELLSPLSVSSCTPYILFYSRIMSK